MQAMTKTERECLYCSKKIVKDGRRWVPADGKTAGIDSQHRCLGYYREHGLELVRVCRYCGTGRLCWTDEGMRNFDTGDLHRCGAYRDRHAARGA